MPNNHGRPISAESGHGRLDVYHEIGIRPFINAYRPLTRLGGAILSASVSNAMREASTFSVDLRELQQKVGASLARMTQNEAAYVSCGAASGITLAVAACIAGDDPELADRLPNTCGMKNRVLIHKRDFMYKSKVAIRNAGARIIGIGDQRGAKEADFIEEIDERTAAIFHVDSDCDYKVPLATLVRLGREHNIPVIVDAAFSVPPKENLWRFTQDYGADGVVISGGKGLRGPQSTGLVLGCKWLIDGCIFHGAPNDRIGRGMKVGKEELMGLYVALREFLVHGDHQNSIRQDQLDQIWLCLESSGLFRLERHGATKLTAHFNSDFIRMTPREVHLWLLHSTPSVYVEPSDQGIVIASECLEPGDESVVVNQLNRLFLAAQL